MNFEFPSNTWARCSINQVVARMVSFLVIFIYGIDRLWLASVPSKAVRMLSAERKWLAYRFTQPSHAIEVIAKLSDVGVASEVGNLRI